MSNVRLHIGDVFDRLATIPDASMDLLVTSPPFLALRSYLPADHPDKAKEIGSEPTPAAFLSTLLALTREWRRVLTPHGSIAVELGDTYSGSPASGDLYETITHGPNGERRGRSPLTDGISRRVNKTAGGWPLAKSLCLIPSLYAGSLAYGHNLLNPDDRIDPMRVRNLIVWHRPNPPVGALGDKVRPSTSYITVACVSDKRWFDLDSERTESATGDRVMRQTTPIQRPTKIRGPSDLEHDRLQANNPAGAPPLDCWIDGDVWTIPTQPYKGAHYATYPIALPRRLINLMCPRQVCTVCGEPRRRIVAPTDEYAARPFAGRGGFCADAKDTAITGQTERNGWRGTAQIETLGWSNCGHDSYRRGHILDPFAGSGTTGAAAVETGRDCTLIDLDDRNLWLIRERVGLFLEDVT